MILFYKKKTKADRKKETCKTYHLETETEQVILQTMANAKHPKFKQAQKILIKSPMMDSGLESFF